MRVVPISACLFDVLMVKLLASNGHVRVIDESTHEIIGEFRPRRNGALCHTSRSVHGVGVPLEEAMEMDASRLVAQAIGDIDDNTVTNRCLDRRTRPFSVDADDRSFHTVRITPDP